MTDDLQALDADDLICMLEHAAARERLRYCVAVTRWIEQRVRRSEEYRVPLTPALVQALEEGGQ